MRQLQAGVFKDCFLLAHSNTEDHVGRNGWVAFLSQVAASGAGAPARMSHDSFKLALLDKPMRAGWRRPLVAAAESTWV